MSNVILLCYPIAFCCILFFGAGAEKKGAFSENAWSVEQTGRIQAFAALMILLHHTVQSITDYGRVWKGPVTLWNSFGILFTSVFFFCSGFGLCKSCRTKEHYLDGFFKQRIPKVLIPFLLTNLLYLLTVSGGRVRSLRHVFTSILGITLINDNAWFIVELLILYLAFYFLKKRLPSGRSAYILLTVFALLLVTLGMLLGHDVSEVNGHWFMGEWWYNTTLIFPLGILFAEHEEKIRTFMIKGYRILLPLSLPALVGSFLLEEFVVGRFGYYREWPGHPGIAEKTISLAAQMLFCTLFLFLLLLLNLKLTFHNPVLNFLSRMSYELFLIHEIFRRWLPHGQASGLQDVWYIGSVYLLSVAAACLLYLLDRFLIDVWTKQKPRWLIWGLRLFYLFVLLGLVASFLFVDMGTRKW